MNNAEVMPGPGTEPAIRPYEPVPELTEAPPEYNPPTSQQLLSDYEIRIRFLAKGCVVSVGCKELAFSSIEEAMISIQEYVENPKGVGDYWRRQFNMVTY